MIGTGYLIGGASAVSAALGAAAVIAWSFSPWGAETKLDSARLEIVRVEGERDAANGRADAAELARKGEADAARQDYADLGKQCAAASSRALASGLNIGRIVTHGETNPDGSPRRRIVGAGELRGAVGQPSASGS